LNKRAFTLAEILITLATIGVIAVLIIPNLLADIEEKKNGIVQGKELFTT